MGWKNTVKRALRTFFQAALGYLVAALGGGLTGLYDAEGKISRVAVGGLVVSAVAAGLAALMNLPEKAQETESVDTETENAPKKVVEDIDELPMAGQTKPAFVYDEKRHGECDTDNDEEGGDDE